MCMNQAMHRHAWKITHVYSVTSRCCLLCDVHRLFFYCIPTENTAAELSQQSAFTHSWVDPVGTTQTQPFFPNSGYHFLNPFPAKWIKVGYFLWWFCDLSKTSVLEAHALRVSTSRVDLGGRVGGFNVNRWKWKGQLVSNLDSPKFAMGHRDSA